MRLATLRRGGRDGTLVVIHRQGDSYALASSIAPTLQSALDDWSRTEPALSAIAEKLDRGEGKIALDPKELHSPLPRAYEWVDGSAFLNHVILVRKARGAEPPETLRTDPLVYQGGSSVLLGPTEDIVLHDPSWGLDFESEVCVILGDTPIGVSTAAAGKYIKLVCLANDITLRNLVPNELAKQFGFFNSKPATAFSPFALTPDELGDAWQNGRLNLPLRTTYNGKVVGTPIAGSEMHFSFFELIAHITKTRAFSAGTILGSGTVSNADRSRGISRSAERRMIEIIDGGKAITPFMSVGDTVEIEMLDANNRNLFGTIRQRVVAP